MLTRGKRKIKCNADERCSLRLDAAKQLFSAKQKMQTIPVRVTPHRKVWDFFFRFPAGIEEGGLGKAKVKKCPGDIFLARGRFPELTDATGRLWMSIQSVDCWEMFLVCLLFLFPSGIEKSVPTCRGQVGGDGGAPRSESKISVIAEGNYTIISLTEPNLYFCQRQKCKR